MLTEVRNIGATILQAMQVSSVCEDNLVDENKENVNAVTTNALADVMNTLKVLTKELNELKGNSNTGGSKGQKGKGS